MKRPRVNIVWLKRDLRTQDHECFQAAEKSVLPYISICLLEPKLLRHRDSSLRHVQFIYHSVDEINKKLSKYNRKVHLLYCDAYDAFQFLDNSYFIHSVYSYEEFATQSHRDRNIEINQYFEEKGIQWVQFERDAIRNKMNQTEWEENWKTYMQQPPISNKFKYSSQIPLVHSFDLPYQIKKDLKNYPENYPPAGEWNARNFLDKFISKWAFDNDPFPSRLTNKVKNSDRLSVYLSWGNLSVRQVYQLLVLSTDKNQTEHPFQFILHWLKWRCSCMQLFKNEPEHEEKCCDETHEKITHTNDDELLKAWQNGATGVPIVDAGIRALKANGSLHSELQVILISFLCFHLDQDWHRGIHFLAKQFIDYDPSIHYTQFTIYSKRHRISPKEEFNPIYLSSQYDPKGKFIKKWIPELEDVPEEFIHTPWTIKRKKKKRMGASFHKYPVPVVDLSE